MANANRSGSGPFRPAALAAAAAVSLSAFAAGVPAAAQNGPTVTEITIRSPANGAT